MITAPGPLNTNNDNLFPEGTAQRQIVPMVVVAIWYFGQDLDQPTSL
jgi:hypothetical protein